MDERGPENATFTYIDFDEPETFSVVPIPIRKPLPEKWIKSSNITGDSGSLMIWTKPDRFSWKTSKAVHRNSEFIIGRMYRKHITDNGVSIRIAAYDDAAPYNIRGTDTDRDGEISKDEEHNWFVRANDPLYLDPEAFDGNAPETPAFEMYGEPEILTFEWEKADGTTASEDVTLTFSIAKSTTRAGNDYDPAIHNGEGGKQEHGCT